MEETDLEIEYGDGAVCTALTFMQTLAITRRTDPAHSFLQKRQRSARFKLNAWSLCR